VKVDHTLLKPGPCPFCEKRIIEKNGKQNEYYREFWVQFNDDTKAAFACCSDCFNHLNVDRVEKLVSDQLFTWGQEILKQHAWFVNSACHLRLKAFAKDKSEF